MMHPRIDDLMNCVADNDNAGHGSHAVVSLCLTVFSLCYLCSLCSFYFLSGHLSRTGRSHLVPETSGGSGADGLPPFDTVQYLNSSIRPMLVDALVQVGRQRSKEPSKAFATAVATSAR